MQGAEKVHKDDRNQWDANKHTTFRLLLLFDRLSLSMLQNIKETSLHRDEALGVFPQGVT